MKKKLSVLVLALAMVLTMSVSVFADTPSAEAALDASMISMELDIAEGTVVPDATFTYSFAGQASETVTAAQAGNFSTAASDLNKDIKTSSSDTIANNKVLKNLNLSDIFSLGSNVAGKKNLNHAGEWVYTVTQTATCTAADGTNKVLTPESKTYTLRIYVTNNGDNLVANRVTVDSTGAEDNKTDNDGKVDPAPAQGGDGSSSFRWVNSYYEIIDTNDGGDPEGPGPGPDGNTDCAFSLKKAVDGQWADKTLDFAFAVSFDYPTTVPNAAATFETSGAGGNLSEALSELDLHHNEYFEAKKLPVGTKITVVETQAPKYTGLVTGSVNVSEQDKGANVTVSQYVVTKDGANLVFTNKLADSEVTPTGIIINNLPYVLLIGIALGGIVLFSRKRRYE